MRGGEVERRQAVDMSLGGGLGERHVVRRGHDGRKFRPQDAADGARLQGTRQRR
jgi:hypothetical protein